MLDYISVPHVFIIFLYHFGMIYGTTLLTRCPVPVPVFCFRKVVRGSFSELAENLHDLFLRRNKDGARRGPAGGPTVVRRPPGVVNTWAAPGSHLDASGASSSCPFAYKSPSSQKPSIPDHILQKTFEAAADANIRSGGSWSSSRHPAGGEIITRGIYTTMPASGVMRE